MQAAQDALDTFIAAYLAMRGAVADANAHEHALAHIPGPEHGRVGLEAAYDHEYAARRAKEMKASVKDTNDFENFLYVVGNPHCRQGELPHPTEAQSDEDDDIMVSALAMRRVHVDECYGGQRPVVYMMATPRGPSISTRPM